MLRTVIVLLCALIPIAIGAQTDTTGRAPLPRCWRGKPLPLCRSFFLTEMAGEYAFATTKTTNGNHVEGQRTADESAQLLWRIGPMFNTAATQDQRRAVRGLLGRRLTHGYPEIGGASNRRGVRAHDGYLSRWGRSRSCRWPCRFCRRQEPDARRWHGRRWRRR